MVLTFYVDRNITKYGVSIYFIEARYFNCTI